MPWKLFPHYITTFSQTALSAGNSKNSKNWTNWNSNWKKEKEKPASEEEEGSESKKKSDGKEKGKVFDISNLTCFTCGQKGHFAKDYREVEQKKQKEEEFFIPDIYEDASSYSLYYRSLKPEERKDNPDQTHVFEIDWEFGQSENSSSGKFSWDPTTLIEKLSLENRHKFELFIAFYSIRLRRSRIGISIGGKLLSSDRLIVGLSVGPAALKQVLTMIKVKDCIYVRFGDDILILGESDDLLGQWAKELMFLLVTSGFEIPKSKF